MSPEPDRCGRALDTTEHKDRMTEQAEGQDTPELSPRSGMRTDRPDGEGAARGRPAGEDPARRRATRAGDATPSAGLARRIVLRSAALLLSAIGLYILWPSLAEVFKSWPSLRDVDPFWFLIMGAAEVGSFVCLWVLLRLVLHTKDWMLVSTTQLASNAIARIVPGGAATAGGLQYSMLVHAGVDGSRAGTGVTAATAITTATLFALPLLTVPSIIGGLPVPRGLGQAALLGVGAFVVVAAVGALAFLSNLPLRWAGRLLQRVRNGILRRREPLTGVDERLIKERDELRHVLGKRYWEAVLTAVGKQLLDFMALLIALVAVGARPSPSLALLAYVVSSILGMVPLTPGGLGFVEAGLLATLKLAGVPASQAVVATLAYRLWSYWIPLLAGPGGWLLYRRRFGRPSHLVAQLGEEGDGIGEDVREADPRGADA